MFLFFDCFKVTLVRTHGRVNSEKNISIDMKKKIQTYFNEDDNNIIFNNTDGQFTAVNLKGEVKNGYMPVFLIGETFNANFFSNVKGTNKIIDISVTQSPSSKCHPIEVKFIKIKMCYKNDIHICYGLPRSVVKAILHCVTL